MCVCVYVYVCMCVCVYVCTCVRVCTAKDSTFRITIVHKHHGLLYRVASVSSIDKTIGLFCKRALLKRRYSAKETYNLIDPTDRGHRISVYLFLNLSWFG